MSITILHFHIRILVVSLILAGTMAWSAFPQETNLPKRLSRKDSYFGVHFDFHALKTDKNIGENTTPEMIEAIIEMIGPDYIEVDTKGHPGVSSYPTKVGFHADNFIGDPLRVWRDVTAKYGVALYGHYSGLWDDFAMEKHPQWGIVDANGKLGQPIASVFGPYVDQLLIPQLVELGADYGLDGVWIDGNIWKVSADYSEPAKKAFTRETGVENPPTNLQDPHLTVWVRFLRELYRNYMRYTIAQVKEKVPGFQICDNWAFTEQMPEPVGFDIDYISGDICGYNCVNVSRFASRFMASQEVPWDLMSWSFYQWGIGNLDPPETRKPAVQLQREAACIIAQGGGYQAVFSQAGPGFPPRRDGSVDLEKLKPMAEVARFCRERQEICFKAKAVPQIAILYSTEAAYRKWDKLGQMFFWDTWQRGIVNALLENQCCVEVLLGDKLVKKIEKYPLVVVCEWEYLEPEVRDAIAQYVENGGKLLLIGQVTIRLFEKELTAAVKKSMVDVPLPYSMIRLEVGKGSIGIIPHTVTNEYAGNPTPELHGLIGAAVRNLFPDPIVTVTGSNDIDVSLMRTVGGKLAVHLVNTSGPHRTAGKIENIDPVGPLQVTIRSATRPQDILLQPEGKVCDFNFADGKATSTIDSVPIHSILVVNPY